MAAAAAGPKVAQAVEPEVTPPMAQALLCPDARTMVVVEEAVAATMVAPAATAEPVVCQCLVATARVPAAPTVAAVVTVEPTLEALAQVVKVATVRALEAVGSKAA